MNEPVFQVLYEGDDRLRVKTPFPVTQNVWSNFVLEIFPDLIRPPQNQAEGTAFSKYLNRRTDYDEISEGQVFGYVHAYIPKLERTPTRSDVTGLIHVPEKRKFYLEQIEADLTENPKTRVALLNRLQQIHSETVEFLVDRLMKSSTNPGESPKVTSTKELRDYLGEQFFKANLLQGHFTDYGDPNWIYARDIDKLPIGKLPLFMRGKNIDNLRTQTCLDFLRNLDTILEQDRPLNLATLMYIPFNLLNMYSDILRYDISPS